VGDWPLATAYTYRAAGDNHGQLTPKWLMLSAEFSFWGSQITPPTAGARCGGRMLWGTNRGKADLPQGGFSSQASSRGSFPTCIALCHRGAATSDTDNLSGARGNTGVGELGLVS
jgi:hypothetical protein